MENKGKKVQILPIFLILSFVPLIVRLKIIKLNNLVAIYWTDIYDVDFFSYYKRNMFLILLILSIGMFIILYDGKNVKFKKKTFLYVLSIIYSILIIISSLISNYQNVAIFGFPNRYEGLIALLGYILVFIITFNLINTEKQVQFLIKGFLISALLIGIIGFFQYFNKDIFSTLLMKKIIIPQERWNLINNLKFTLGERAVYGTLYHTNYMGSFMAIAFPLAFSLSLLSRDSKQKLIYFFISILFLFNLITSHSRAGILGVIVSILIMIIFLRKYLIKHYKIVSLFLLLSIFSMIIANKFWNGYLFNKIGTLYTDAKQMFSDETLTSNIDDIINIDTSKNELILNYKKDSLRFKVEENNLIIFNKNNQTISFDYDNSTGRILFRDDYFKNKIFYYGIFENKPIIKYDYGQVSIYFVYIDGKFKIFKRKDFYYDIKPVEKIGFEGKESLGSARTYIWSRTLPLIKKSPLFGYGPDTFAMVFPQHDVIGKANVYGDPYILVDKPHNMYLQTAVNTGIPSLLALIAIFILYISESTRLYIKGNFNGTKEAIGMSIFLGIVAYLVAGFFNDSVVSVAPVFWVLLGIGFGVNYHILMKSK